MNDLTLKAISYVASQTDASLNDRVVLIKIILNYTKRTERDCSDVHPDLERIHEDKHTHLLGTDIQNADIRPERGLNQTHFKGLSDSKEKE